MPAPYSEKHKKEVLLYARDHGVNAAAKHYGIPHATITRWNKTLKIYAPQTPSYSSEQRLAILNYAAQHGKRAAARKFGASVASIDLWNKELKIFGPRQKKFTRENKLEILECARDFGILAAADKYDVLPSQIIGWNKTLKVYVLRTNYTEDERIKILTYARDHGVTAAEKEFDVTHNTLQRWNRVLQIYKKREPATHNQYTTEKQIAFLQLARKEYDNMPADARSAQQAFIAVTNDHDVTIDQLRKWNEKYKLVPLRKRAKKVWSQEEIDNAQAALDASRGHFTAAARRSSHSPHTIKKMQKEKKIAFSKAQKKIATRPPVGKNKSKTIVAIIQGLLNAKASK
ncbi:MAG: hypothetical protein K2I81_04980 [Alphaproteobacteria bacterium]|nr:hypothetical protein [Alphaproteobacteria bacterium]